MAVVASVVHSCSMGFSEKCLRRAIIFEAERGYRNIFGKSLRFNNFLPSKILTLCFRTKHNFSEKMLEGVAGYEKASALGQSKLLDKEQEFKDWFISPQRNLFHYLKHYDMENNMGHCITCSSACFNHYMMIESVLMGYNGLDDLIDNAREKFHENTEFDVSLACKQFPSITMGYFPTVELYDGTIHSSGSSKPLAPEILEGYLPSPVDANWVNPNCMYGPTDSLYAEISNVKSSYILEEKFKESPMYFRSPSLETEVGNDLHHPRGETCSSSSSWTQQTTISVADILDKSVSCISGLSKRQLSQLENSGFHTLRKLLHHFPRTYADLQNAEVEIDDGQYLIFVGKIISSRGIRASFSFSFLEVVVACEVADIEANFKCMDNEAESKRRKIYLHLKKFFRGARFTCQPFLRSLQEKHKEGDLVCVSGKVRTMRCKDHFEMREYNIDVLKDEEDSSVYSKGRPYPIYPSKKGLNPDFLRDIISRALKTLPDNLDPIPKDVTQDFGLLCLSDAYIGIHQPKNLNEADLARKRLIFDEFFYLQLGRLFQMLEGLGTKIEKDGLLDKYRKPELNSTIMEEWSCMSKKFVKALPYSLTRSQLNATSEIIWDLKRAVPMNRLLQGDVGCGKTVVAFLACTEVIGSGYQAAFMVPTELLAVQHYENLLHLLEKMEDIHKRPSVALLTGSTPTKQAQFIRKGLQAGDISLVIGTHTLIAEKVEFSALRIAIVDEQHRFGVVQRGRFNSKLYFNSISSKLASASSKDSQKSDIVMAPHVLAMSATPIPRTLALALYGDMSLTQITDLPPGRTPVETYIIEGNETGFEKIYQMMEEELGGGGKVYLVYPVIEQSEQLPQLRAASADLETISRRFPYYNCGLLHGKMKSDEKDEALMRFRAGETNILLSTQVIEIGVDVPDASMMVVLNAERFGIAQLHQLRGRVGRGERKSKCILSASTTTSLNRLKVLGKSSDGFYLANMDLLLRGPGDLLGKKQSGHLPEFPIARLEIDGNILQEAHLAALKVLGESHDLEKFPDLKAELSMRQPLCLLGD